MGRSVFVKAQSRRGGRWGEEMSVLFFFVSFFFFYYLNSEERENMFPVAMASR